MATVRKFSIGVQPFTKMFRMLGVAGSVCDAVLRLRSKALADDFYKEVGWSNDRTVCRLSNGTLGNLLTLTEESVVFTKDCHENDKTFSFDKTLAEFKTVYAALNAILNIQDIRRVGLVAEYRLTVDAKSPSSWLREKLSTSPSTLVTDKFFMKYEEREFAADGRAPDPKKADFINYIYHFYDSVLDADHSKPGFVDVNLDVQHYFAPVLNSSVPDEVQKLHRHFEAAQKRLLERLKALGAIHGTR